MCIALTICGIQLNFQLEPRRWRGDRDSKADYPGSSSEHSDEELSASNDGRGRVTGVPKTVGWTKLLTAPGRGKDRARRAQQSAAVRKGIALPNQAHRRRSGCAACLHVRPCTSRSDRSTDGMCHRFGHAAMGLGHRPTCLPPCMPDKPSGALDGFARAPKPCTGTNRRRGRTHKQSA